MTDPTASPSGPCVVCDGEIVDTLYSELDREYLRRQMSGVEPMKVTYKPTTARVGG